MADLTKEEIHALGHAVGLEIEDPELTEVMYSPQLAGRRLGAIQSSAEMGNP